MDTPDPLTTTGSRAELVAELRRLVEGWWHLGKPRNAEACAEGIDALLNGADSVDVGFSEYRVTEATQRATIL